MNTAGIQCPYCGSSDIAGILWGLPVPDWEEQAEKNGEKWVLGGCLVSDDDPHYECQGCGKQFGSRPFSKREEDKAAGRKVLLPDVITGITFSVGGYFGGSECVKIVREGDRCAVCVYHEPVVSDDDIFSIREYPDLVWNNVINILFGRLFVHEWEREYTDPDIMDGTQWELVFSFDRGEDYGIYGSNAYPPLFDDLRMDFQIFRLGKGPKETDPSKRDALALMFRKDPCLLSAIAKYFAKEDQN